MSAAAVSTTAAAVRSALSRHSRIHAWQLRTVRSAGIQTYLVKAQREGERHIEGETHEVTVFVMNGDRLGRAVVTLGPGDQGSLAQRIEDAVYMAGLGGDTPWQLPAGGAWPTVETSDPALVGPRARATSLELVGAWRSAVAKQSGIRPSSMELFCGEEWITLENSAGLRAQSAATRVSLLTLLLADGEHASERYSWDERRRVADLDVGAIVGRVGEEARDLTRAVAPPSGQYAVVIDADEMGALLSPIQSNASAEVLYQKSSRFEIGKPLPIEADKGEPLTVISNAIAPFGLTSYAFDGSGVAGQRIEIVKDGVFTRAWATKQFADYLEIPPTGGFANWEIPAGKTPLAELTGGEGPVLYVRAFSWLTPDEARGNFGSEVRVGYLYQDGKRTPVKGGTVSGNLFSALGTARYSKETVFIGEYYGPAAVRLEGLTVAGV